MSCPRMAKTIGRTPRRWFPAIVLFVLGTAWGAVPPLVSYQGKLLGPDGAPVPDGMYRMEFRFWDNCSGGNLLLTDVHEQVQARDGLYAVLLGGGTLTPGGAPDLLSVFRLHDVVCLGVRVENDTEMAPRQQIVAAAFALRSATADGGPSGAIVEPGDDVTWTGAHTFESTVELRDNVGLSWPHQTGNPPPDADFAITKFVASPATQAGHPNGEQDEQWMFCYNCAPDGSTLKHDLSQHSFNVKFEANYWDGARELNEFNWNFRSPHRCLGGASVGATCRGAADCPGGSCTAGPDWRPFALVLQVTDTCSGGTQDARACISQAERAACVAGGGRCEGSNGANFTWDASQKATCSNDPSRICDAGIENSGQCGAGVCQRPMSDMNLWLKTGVLDLAQGLRVTATHPGIQSVTDNSYHGIWVNQKVAPYMSGKRFSGLRYNGVFGDMSASGAQLQDWRGAWVIQSFEGSATPGRGVSGEMVGYSSEQVLSQTAGGSPSIQTLAGFRYLLSAMGRNVSVGTAAGLLVGLAGPVGASQPVQFGRLSGVEIGDLLGVGGENQAIRVASQSGARGDKGNLQLVGGGATTGHVQFGTSGHLFWDSSAGVFRTKNATAGAPTSNSDGTPVHAPPGMSNDWGVALWGRGGSATGTGDAVCAAARLTCVETFAMGSNTAKACSHSGYSGRFLVLCR